MVDYYQFLNMSAEEMKENWLDFIVARDPLLADRSDYTFNAILAEAIAAKSATMVWAIGSDDTLYYWNGLTWTQSSTDTVSAIALANL